MKIIHVLAVGTVALALAVSPGTVRASGVSFTDPGTYGVAFAPWEGSAVASASFDITFDPTQIYPIQPLDSIITNLTYSVTDPRFGPNPLAFDPIASFQYAYGTLTLYSDSALGKNLALTPNITIGINGFGANPNPASGVWYSQTDFEDTLTTSGSVSITASPVPLPATLPLFASGLAGLGWLSRRRRKQLQVA